MSTKQINDIEVHDFVELNEIAEAKKLLKDAGYYVDNLWHVEDVKSRFKCDDEEAQEVLDCALNNDSTMHQIWVSIEFESYDMNLKRI